MNVQIDYKNTPSQKTSINHILFTEENFNISGLKKLFSAKEYSTVTDLIKSKDINKKIISLDISSKKKNYFNFIKKKDDELRI